MLGVIAVYVALGQLIGLVVLGLATIFQFDVPGYHEPGSYGWWSWVLLGLWFAGLVVIIWWVGFRAKWWRRPANTRAP